MNFTEDAEIMAARARLETWWNQHATDEQRQAWLYRMSTRPPIDIKGRRYVTHVPTGREEFQVTEATQFAWSQIWGTLRAGMPLVETPAPLETFTLEISQLYFHAYNISAAVRLHPPSTAPHSVTIYATPPQQTPQRNPLWQLRHVETFAPRELPSYFDCTDAYGRRWDLSEAKLLYVCAGVINANNELDGLSDIVEAQPE